MNDWFEWNGVRCTEYGIHVLEQPPITFASERATFTDVLGKSGSLAVLEGTDVYEDLTLTATCYIADTSRIREIGSYLKGSGTVAFANRQGGYYFGRIVNQIPFEAIMRGHPQRRFAVNFRCSPFWYAADAAELTFTAASNDLNNPGSVYSQPRITVYGRGDILITVAGQMMALAGIEEGIILDTQLQDALNLEGSQLLNSHVTGDFLVLQPGYNVLAWLPDDAGDNPGVVTKIVVNPRWRYL